MKDEKYKEAIQCYTKAMELDSANAVFPCNRFALCGSRRCPLPPPHPMRKGFFLRYGNSNLPIVSNSYLVDTLLLWTPQYWGQELNPYKENLCMDYNSC